jgi:ATP-dependent DNA helicase RecG
LIYRFYALKIGKIGGLEQDGHCLFNPSNASSSFLDYFAYIRNNIIEERVQKISGRAEADRYFNYPYDAVEEALANAVYHKSYELGKPIEVQIWPDKIEVLSFPGPVPPVNARILAENRRIVARDYRNRRVGDFLKELHLTEGRGTGIPTMRRAMERNGSPLPILETDEQCTYFLTTLPVHPTFEGDQVSNEVSDQVSDQVDPLVFKVIEACQTPLSRMEILNQLGFKNHFDNYKKYIAPALDCGWIERTVPDKPRSRNQKYRITALGRAVVER